MNQNQKCESRGSLSPQPRWPKATPLHAGGLIPLRVRVAVVSRQRVTRVVHVGFEQGRGVVRDWSVRGGSA
jgi:hypothetical protein